MKTLSSVAVVLGLIAVLVLCYKPYIVPAYHTRALQRAAEARDSAQIERHKEALIKCGRLKVYEFNNLKPDCESSLEAIHIECNQTYPTSMFLSAWDGNNLTIWAAPDRSSFLKQLMQKHDVSQQEN